MATPPAAATVGNRPAALIVALDKAPFMDATGIRALAEADRCARLTGTQITGPRPPGGLQGTFLIGELFGSGRILSVVGGLLWGESLYLSSCRGLMLGAAHGY